MTPNEMRIAIAEVCGLGCKIKLEEKWKEGTVPFSSCIPDYPNDLNAMMEAKQTLKPCRISTGGEYESELWGKYVFHFTRTCEVQGVSVFAAPAIIEAEAFLRTHGKWKEEE